MNSTETAQLVGWQDQSGGRGTFDILKACLGTIVLLCWSSVCPNVPSQRGGRWAKLRSKLVLFLIALLGPDFVFFSALAQLNAAWRAKKAFNTSGFTSWTLRHSFFVNMGALHIQFPDRKASGLAPVPIDCEQLLYLIKHNYLALPAISIEDIDDRNKTDDLARTLAVIQTLWFTISTLARVAQDLFLTSLELTTLSFVFMMACCTICWWRKPMDVSRPIFVDIDTALAQVQIAAQAPNPVHGRTPLSFLNRDEWLLSRLFSYYTQILRRLIPWLGAPASDRFPAIEFRSVDIKWEILYGWPIVAYSCIFMAAWNFQFPTTAEQQLWRAAAIINVAFGFLGCIIAWTSHNADTLHKWWQSLPKLPVPQTRRTTKQESRTSRLRKLLEDISSRLDFLRSLSPDHDPALRLPALLQLTATVLCVSYCLSRAYILVEDFVGLRNLPASAYQTVNWAQYSPLL